VVQPPQEESIHQGKLRERIEVQQAQGRLDKTHPIDDLDRNPSCSRLPEDFRGGRFGDERMPGDPVHDSLGILRQRENIIDDTIVDFYEGIALFIIVIKGVDLKVPGQSFNSRVLVGPQIDLRGAVQDIPGIPSE
jgi:hypothetical protein